MADAPQAYLLDEDGKVVAADADEAPVLQSIGYVPAGAQQVEDFKREQAFHEKYGTFGQQLKTFGEGAAQSLTLGASTPLERAFGVKPEDIKARQEENPKSHLSGVLAGVAAPLLLTGGLSAAPEGLVAGARLTAPSLISSLGESATEGVAGLLGESAHTALGRILVKAASSGVGSAIEGSAYGLGQVVHEASLGDPNLTASRMVEEIGLSALLGGGIGAGTGALGQLLGEAANSPLGEKLWEWTRTFEGNQNLKTAAGPGKGQAAIRNLQKSGLSPDEVAQLGREAGDLRLEDGRKLIGPLDQAASVFERAQELKGEVAPKMGDILHEVDNSGWAKPKSINKIAAEFRSDVLEPYGQNPANRQAVKAFSEYLDANETRFGTHVGGDATRDITFDELHQLRQEADAEAFGLNKAGFANPELSKSGHLYHEFRKALSEEINNGLKDAALPQATAEEWMRLNRTYSIASKISAIAKNGAAGRGLSGISLTALASGLTGLVSGGPLGAAALGGAAMLAKRYGPQALAAGARGVRRFVEEGAAEGLASRTAEALSAAREMGNEGAASGLATAWNRVSEALGDPVGGPTKDFLRDVSKEHLAEKGAPAEGTPVETVAALSQLERVRQRVENRVQAGASALIHGTAKAARGEAMAGVANAYAKSDEDAAAAYAKRAERVRLLSANPNLMAERLQHAVGDLAPHAPQTSQAYQVALTRAVVTLNKALPPLPPRAPLEKPQPPAPDQVAKFQRVFEVVQKPSLLFAQAAAGTLTPEAVQAVRQAHPQQFAAMQQALLEKLATHRGTIPYVQRQMASLIMGRDLDGTQSPQAVAAHQAVFAAPAPSAGTGIKPTSKGLEKLHLSNRMRTPAQASASRGTGD